MRPSTPLSLSAGLYGPVLAVKGSASPRFAPWTAPGQAWGLTVYEGKGGTANGGDLHPDAVAQTDGSAKPRPWTGFQGVRLCETVLQYGFDWR